MIDRVGRGVVATLGLIVVSGCDWLLGLSSVSPPPVDAVTVDTATSTSCANSATSNAPPFLCADFDDVDPKYYSNGLAFPLGVATGAATFARRAPAVSPPNALWITTNGGQYYNEVISPSPQGSRLLATFDLDVSAFEQVSNVVFLQLNGPSGNAVSVELGFVASGSPRAYIQAHCAPVDCDHSKPLFDVLPVGWIHGQLGLDTTAATGTIHIDPNLDAEVSLTTIPFMGSPMARFGTIDVNTGAMAVLGIDSLHVELE